MKAKISRILAFLIAMVMVLSVSVSASADASAPRRIVIQTLADPGSFKLFDASASSVRQAIQVMFYETLFGDYFGDAPTPVLASGIEQVDKGVYEVTLRDGIYDAKGNPITMDDVIWCYQTAIDSGTMSNYFGNVKSIEKVDEHVLRITFLSDEYVGELRNVLIIQPIVSRASYEESESGFASDPVGSGPYKIKSWTQGSSIVFEKNEDYWDKENMEALQPYDEVEYRFIGESTQIAIALETGAVDMVEGISNQDVPKFTEEKGFHTMPMIDVLARAILFNCDSSNPFSDVRLRQAVSYAIDADAVIDAVTDGVGERCHALIAANDTTSFTDYNMAWNDEPYYEYDPEMAKQLLAEAGYPDGLKVRLMTKDTPEYNTTCQILQAYLAQVGIDVEIMAYENALYQTYRYDPSAFDMYLAQVGGFESVVQPWKWYVQGNPMNNNRNVCMFDAAEFWDIYSAAAQKETHSPETVEAAWQWMKENVPMYGYGFTQKYFIYNDNVVDPFVTWRGFHFPWLDGHMD